MNKKLFVFDLDFTLWDAGGTWCDCTTPPYFLKNDKILDSYGLHIQLYPEVLKILTELTKRGKQIAVASRTSAPSIARELMKLLNVTPFIHYQEIYPGSKTQHFAQLRQKSGFPYEKMVFFDDEHRNIVDISPLGVTSVLVNAGISWDIVNKFLS